MLTALLACAIRLFWLAGVSPPYLLLKWLGIIHSIWPSGAVYHRVIVSIGRVVLSLSFRHLRTAHCRAKSEANCASYRIESKGKRGFPRYFRGLRNLLYQENGARACDAVL